MGDAPPSENVTSSRRPLHLAAAAALALFVLAAVLATGSRRDAWTGRELETLRGLSLGSLPPLPADPAAPSSAYADDPLAADLGHRLFFAVRLSGDGRVACATCHLPELGLTDGKPLGEGVGTTARRTMTVVGTAYSPWLFWDGRA